MPAGCVQIVDKQQTNVLHVPYNVAFDDVALMMGDIALPDAKTHQFFAFRGALLGNDLGHDLYAFAPPGQPPVQLPSWISNADVKRAAQATNTLDGTAFSEKDIPEGKVLDANPQLKDAYLRVSADDARVPITLAQAQKGIDWPLADVALGLYTFAGYIFSPPYNGWAPRAQLIEVVDGSEPGPGATLESVEGGLFPYQGRTLRGCIAAPEGSHVSGAFSVLERPEHGWIEWLASEPIRADALALCFRSPRPELTGSVQLRIDVTTPDGTTRSFYAPDTITALPGSGVCTPSDSVCCPPGSPVDPCATDAATCAERDAGALAPDAAVGGAHGVDAGAAAHGARDAAGDGGDGDAGHANARERSADCALHAPTGAHGRSGDWGLALCLAAGVLRLTRRRRHRTTAGTVE